MSRYLLAPAIAAFVLLAACSTGSDPEPVTLAQYFERVQALHQEQEQASESLGQELASLFSAAQSVEDALEIMQTVLPGFCAVIEETQAGLEALAPPSEVQAEHDELLALYHDLFAFIDDAVEQIERGEGGAEVLQTFLGDRSGTALGVRFSDLANRLVAIAEANGIDVELNAGTLTADSGGSSEPRAREPVVTGVAQAGLTGIAEVDAVVDAVTLASYARDFTALQSLVRFTTTGCTQRLGIGGPPKCLSTTVDDASGKHQLWSEDEGQLVEVFPYSVCEGEYERRDGEVARLLTALAAPDGEPGLVERVFAVYDLRGNDPGAPYWPEGDYAIVFAMRQGDERWGTTVRVGDGGVVRIDFSCGPTPPEEIAPLGTNILLTAGSDSPGRAI